MLTGFQAILFSHINLYLGIVLAFNTYIFFEMIEYCWAKGRKPEALSGIVVILLTSSMIIIFNNLFSAGITIGIENSGLFIKPLKHSCALGFFFGFWAARLISEAIIYWEKKTWAEMTILVVLAAFVLTGAALADSELLYRCLLPTISEGAIL